MAEPMSNGEIEDVLSSIRRLVSEDMRPPARGAAEAGGLDGDDAIEVGEHAPHGPYDHRDGHKEQQAPEEVTEQDASVSPGIESHGAKVSLRLRVGG